MRRVNIAFYSLTLFGTIAFATLLNPVSGSAQPAPDPESQLESRILTQSVDEALAVRRPQGQDYFMAGFDPKVKAWLALVQQAHAGEWTWNFYRTGQYKSALGDCEYTLARFPNHPGALFLMGEIAKVLDQTSMPIPYFETALKYYPQYAYTHAQYGHYLTGIGATAAGIVELNEALRLDPNLLQARAWLAEALGAGDNQGSQAPDSAKVESAKSRG